jgi:nucleotidyltransferase/DNA polymerase involved in DNA repair
MGDASNYGQARLESFQGSLGNIFDREHAHPEGKRGHVCEHVFPPMVICVHLPRFELAVASGGRSQTDRNGSTLTRRPLAVAPTRSEGGGGRLGEVSAAAEAHGVVSGMALSEALARCPELELVPSDPLGVAEAWETILQALESLGAAVEAPAAGLAFFEADGLLRLHRGLSHLLDEARRACGVGAGAGPVRIGVGPSRFAALAAAVSARSRHGGAHVIEGGPTSVRSRLAARPIELLRFADQIAPLLAPMRRLGLRSLGDLQALGRDVLADRFGPPGGIAHDLASGIDTPLQPRLAPERLAESIELHEADIGPALERVLAVLIERLLARRERDGRSLRSVAISARLVEGGTWRETVVFRRAIADPLRISLALRPRLANLPAPAEALRVEVERFGPPLGEQGELPGFGGPVAGDARLAEAIDQARAAAGPDAALRIVCIEPDSRVPERRAALAPFQV